MQQSQNLLLMVIYRLLTHQMLTHQKHFSINLSQSLHLLFWPAGLSESMNDQSMQRSDQEKS